MSPPGPASVTFTFETAELDDEILVTVTGDLDGAAAGDFRRRLDDAARPGKPLFLDLTAVTFLGGAGYRAIHAAAAATPMTAATSSPVIATVLRAVPGSAIRVQAS
jgi:anti-anti-sigma factor